MRAGDVMVSVPVPRQAVGGRLDGEKEAGRGGSAFPSRSIHGFVTRKTHNPSASRKALLALYFGRHRRFREARKKAFKIVKGTTNWISEVTLKRL